MSKETYDPDPRRRRRHRGPRKGVEPAGLKRWRLAHKRTHDPSAARRRKPWHRGPRGGKYWKGPTTRRYDTPRFARVRSYGRRIGGKAENFINKYGTWLGAGLSALAGVGSALQTYFTYYGNNALSDYWKTIVGGIISTGEARNPEIMNIMGDPDRGLTSEVYLKYKFGLIKGGRGETCSWAIPFWLSLIGFILSKLPLPIPSWARIRKPLGKIAAPALIVSTIGALALPGCPDSSPANSASTSNPQSPRTNYVYGK